METCAIRNGFRYDRVLRPGDRRRYAMMRRGRTSESGYWKNMNNSDQIVDDANTYREHYSSGLQTAANQTVDAEDLTGTSSISIVCAKQTD